MDREDDQLLTVPEVSAYLRVGQESTRRWLREGKLDGISLGRKSGWRIRRGDLARFIVEHRGPLRAALDGHGLSPDGHGLSLDGHGPSPDGVAGDGNQ